MERSADLLQVALINLNDTRQGTELRAGVFYQQLLTKLTSKTLTEYYHWVHLLARTESIETLLEWVAIDVNFLITTSQTINSIASAESPTGTRYSPKPRPAGGMSTAFSLATSASNIECVFCSQPHESTSCTLVTDITRRRDQLMRTGRCFNCLRHNHGAHMCHSKDRCY